MVPGCFLCVWCGVCVCVEGMLGMDLVVVACKIID
jgi:hypothetical protein